MLASLSVGLTKRNIALWACLLLIAFTLRALMAIYTPANFDLESYALIARLNNAGINFYAETPRYNYAPLWASILSLLSYVDLPLHITVRLFLSAVDVAAGVTLGLVAHKHLKLSAITVSAAYLLNPVTMFICGWVGQFECLALLPFLIAVYVDKRVFRFVGLTLALIIKHNIAPLVLAYNVLRFGLWRGLALSLAGGLLFLLTLVPYFPGAPAIMTNVVFYTGGNALSGISWLLAAVLPWPVASVIILVLPVFAGLSLLALPSVLRRAHWLYGLAVAVLLWTVLMPRFAPQYLLYVAAMWCYWRRSRWWLLPMSAFVWLWFLTERASLMTSLIWLACVLGLVEALVTLRRQHAPLP